MPLNGGEQEDDPLVNLAAVGSRMDSLHDFLLHSVNSNTLLPISQLDVVSSEISSAIRHVILNASVLLARNHHHHHPLPLPVPMNPPPPPTLLTRNMVEEEQTEMNLEVNDEVYNEDWEIIELDSVELLAEHVHFCDICGKGFKRDANLRMHMRAHGNQFKTPEALAKPEKNPDESNQRKNVRFSCPYLGCNRNKGHRKFRPLKSTVCVKNHFKRSHCPKMYSCNRCNKKSFSVLADLRSHLKHCGEKKWKCSCGTTFSRKDKLFGHIALFEGHMPAVVEEEEKVRETGSIVVIEDDEEDDDRIKVGEIEAGSADNGLFDGLLDGFGAIDGYNLQDVLGMGSPTSGLLGTSTNEFFDI